jgi:hypothetical protein
LVTFCNSLYYIELANLNPLSSHEKILWKFIKTDFSDSLNRTVYASPPVGGSGFCSPRSFRYAPLPRLTPPTFLQPWSLLRKALIRACKNVIYIRLTNPHVLTAMPYVLYLLILYRISQALCMLWYSLVCFRFHWKLITFSITFLGFSPHSTHKNSFPVLQNTVTHNANGKA